jgi:thioredoxin 1
MDKGNKQIVEVGETNFESEVLRSGRPVLVEFFAPWSRPCEEFKSVLDEVGATCAEWAKVVKVNIDKNRGLGVGYGIDFIPALLCFVNGNVRQTLLDVAQSSNGRIRTEVIRDEAINLTPISPSSGWQVETAGGRRIRASLAIIALGHRPPAEQFIRRWKGPRTRFVADPWAALVLTQIGPDEPVLVLGSGLTAVDAILTLDRGDRTAPLKHPGARPFSAACPPLLGNSPPSHGAEGGRQAGEAACTEDPRLDRGHIGGRRS